MFDVRGAQRGMTLIPFTIDGADGSPEVTEGSSYLAVADGGAGVYQVTFGSQYGRASSRAPIVICTGVVSSTGDTLLGSAISVTTTGFTLELSTDAGTLTDGIVSGVIIHFSTADEV